MPDQLNKQAIVNLLIDSPLREPIKINLIDIVNNTSEPDLPKVFPTITKELEIFQKATERRMKLADETIAKLGGTTPAATPTPTLASDTVPPLDFPAMPAAPSTTVDIPTPPVEPVVAPPPVAAPVSSMTPLSVPPLDLPPMPSTTPPIDQVSSPVPPIVDVPLPPTPAAPAVAPAAPQGDEAALAEIQKELDSLKTSVTADATPATAAPVPAV